MFGFLNTTILFAAAAAVIPLIIHLFSRRKVKIIEFSSLRHLKSMQRRQVRKLKIRQLLLLIIRMLILLGVVLAFARPTAKEGGVGVHASVSAVILFDNSASMNRLIADGNLFDHAKKRTADLLATFGQADEICLLPLDFTSDERSSINFVSGAAASERLARVSVSAAIADLEAGLEAARELLDKAVNLNREIYIISDRQRRNLPDESLAELDGIALYLVDLPVEETDNRGIVAIDFGGQLIRAGYDFTVASTIRNYSGESVQDVLVSLFIDEKRIAQTDLSLDAGGESVVKFTRSVGATGFHSGYVELQDDQFSVDNRYYFSFHIPDQFSVLIIDGDLAATFVSLALEPSPETGRYWSTKTARPDQLTGVRFNDYDVVMLLGAPSLAPSHLSRLKAFVRRGKSVFISYGANTDINEFNAFWSGETSVTFEEPIDPEFSLTGYYTFGSISADHPIFSVFPNTPENLTEAKFFVLPKVRTSGAGNTLLQFSGDRHALVESRFGSGRLLTFCAPLVPPYTDLVSHSFFVPFVSRISEYLAADLSSLDLKIFAGDNVTRSIPSTGGVASPIELTSPDGTFYALPPEEEQGTLVYKVTPVDQSGIYTVRHNGREIDRFAVNVKSDEADLTAVDNSQLAAAIGIKDGDYREIKSDEDPAVVIAGLRVGRELWQMFLWAVVLLLIAETLLSRSTPAEE